MKLVSFSVSGGNVHPGALIEEDALVVDLTAAGYPDTLAAIATGFNKVDEPAAYPAYKIGDVRLHAPLANPPRVFAIGLNYRDHAKESNLPLPSAPVVFFKMTTAIVGPSDAIVLPKTAVNPTMKPSWRLLLGGEAIAYLPRNGATTFTAIPLSTM